MAQQAEHSVSPYAVVSAQHFPHDAVDVGQSVPRAQISRRREPPRNPDTGAEDPANLLLQHSQSQSDAIAIDGGLDAENGLHHDGKRQIGHPLRDADESEIRPHRELTLRQRLDRSCIARHLLPSKGRQHASHVDAATSGHP